MRNFQVLSHQSDTAAWGNTVSQLIHVLTSKANNFIQIFWLKMNVFFVSMQPGIGTWDLSITDQSPEPNSCQLPHEISHLHLGSRTVSIPRMTDNGSQATSQNTAPERGWENSRETRMGSRAIFSSGQGLCTLCCLRRQPEIIPGLGSCHSF